MIMPKQKQMGWLLLLIGIAVNLAGVISIKFGQNLEHFALGIAGYIVYFLGFFIISLSFKRLDVGTAYAVWSGLGSLLVLTFGIIFFNEVVSLQKMLFFGLVLLGVIGMSLSN